MVRWLVGDIQGCAREFEKLLRVIRFDPSRDELWCLGDLINRGPDSLSVVRLWRDIGGRGLIGNHEINALQVRSGRRPMKKEDTLDKLFDAPESEELLNLLRELPALVHLPGAGGARDAWIVHAGLDPQWIDLPEVAARIDGKAHDDDWLESAEVACATRMRCCTEEGKRSKFTGPPGECPQPFRPWDEYYHGEAVVVHGHWATRGYYRKGNVIGLDSGCVYGGALTAWCQNEDRIVQVDAL